MSGWTYFRDELPPEGPFWFWTPTPVNCPAVLPAWRMGDRLWCDDGEGEDDVGAVMGDRAWRPYTPGEPAPEWVAPLPELPEPPSGWRAGLRSTTAGSQWAEYHHDKWDSVCIYAPDVVGGQHVRAPASDLVGLAIHAAAVFARDGAA